MRSRSCRRCGLRITSWNYRDLQRKYDEHVVDEHGLPAKAGETVR